MSQDFLVVNSDAGLSRVLPVLKETSVLAVDVEFDNKYSYDMVICLLQVSTGKEIFLFDPLAVDLSPLVDIFSDTSIIKIFFAGIQDIQLLQTHYRWQIRSVVDLSTIYQVICDKNNQTSLNDVIEDCLGIYIPKNKRVQSREDWKQRPLPHDMLEYAAQDVKYLHRALRQLQEDLDEDDLSMLEVYFMQLPLVEDQIENTLMYAFYLCQRYRIHDPEFRHLMFKLVQFREKIAEFTGQSSGYILSRSNLKKMVKKQPGSIKELKREKLYYHNIKEYATEILEIIRNNTGNNVTFDPYYEVLEDRYKKYHPYHEYLNYQNKWPFSIDISTYKHRRNIINVIADMIEDRIEEGRLSYLFTTYLQHHIALHEELNLFDFRVAIEQTSNLQELISVIYRTIEEIYVQRQNDRDL